MHFFFNPKNVGSQAEYRLIRKNPESAEPSSESPESTVVPDWDSVLEGFEWLSENGKEAINKIKTEFQAALNSSSTKEELQEREKQARMTPEKLKKMSPKEIREFFKQHAENNKEVLKKLGLSVNVTERMDERSVKETVLNRSNCPELCIWYDALKDDPERQKAMLQGVNDFTSTIGFTIGHKGGNKTEFGIEKVEAYVPETAEDSQATENDYFGKLIDVLDDAMKKSGASEEDREKARSMFTMLTNLIRPPVTKRAQEGTVRQDTERDIVDLRSMRSEAEEDARSAKTPEEKEVYEKEVRQIEERISSLEESLKETEAMLDRNMNTFEEMVKEAGDLEVTRSGSAAVVHGDREKVEQVCRCAENQGHMVSVYPGGTSAAVTLPGYRNVSAKSVFGFSKAQAPRYFKTDVKRSTQIDAKSTYRLRDMRQYQMRQRLLQYRRNRCLQDARRNWCRINGTRMPARSTWSNLNHSPFGRAGVVYGQMQRGPCRPAGWNRPGITRYQRAAYHRNMSRFYAAQRSMMANRQHYMYHQAQAYRPLRMPRLA